MFVWNLVWCRMNGYEESHVVMQEWKFELDEKNDVSSNQAQAKVAMKTKQPWIFVESFHLSTMAINYWRHFSKYSKDKKNKWHNLYLDLCGRQYMGLTMSLCTKKIVAIV